MQGDWRTVKYKDGHDWEMCEMNFRTRSGALTWDARNHSVCKDTKGGLLSVLVVY